MNFVNLFLHANSSTCSRGDNEERYIYVSMNATTSLGRKKDQIIGRNYVEKFYIAGEKCGWYTVKVRYHADVSVVEPPSFKLSNFKSD